MEQQCKVGPLQLVSYCPMPLFLYDDSDLPLLFSVVSDALTLLPLLRLGRLLFSGVLRLCDRRLVLANKLEERVEETKCRTTRAT